MWSNYMVYHWRVNMPKVSYSIQFTLNYIPNSHTTKVAKNFNYIFNMIWSIKHWNRHYKQIQNITVLWYGILHSLVPTTEKLAALIFKVQEMATYCHIPECHSLTTGTLFYLTALITLFSEHCVWWHTAEHSLLFRSAMSWGPHVLVQYIVVNIRLSLATCKKGAGQILFQSAYTCHISQTCCALHVEVLQLKGAKRKWLVTAVK